MRLLVVTAVAAERAAVAACAPDVDVRVVGVGPAAAAAGTARALADGDHDCVLCAGIGGGFAPLAAGDLAVASTIAFADLGVETGSDVVTGSATATGPGIATGPGFAGVAELGLGVDRYQVAPRLSIELADRTGGHLGTVLTVATVTGSAASADGLLARFPDAVAEGMEGAGVAAAAEAFGVAFGEIRAISNAVGPRDRDAWRIPDALAALGRAVAAIAARAD